MQQNTGLLRNTIDKYYTKPGIVNQCISFIKQYVTIFDNDYIIEPSAGSGSFIEGIQSLSSNCLFMDIEPEHANVLGQDYLTYEIDPSKTIGKKIHVIGNPPFGRQSSMAIKFIKKSCEFCDSISFILPKSFKKDSMKKHFPLKYHLEFEMDLPVNSFTVEGIEHDVPCVFQIWVKRESNRHVNEKLDPVGFIFVEKTENPDISFRRVGVNAGIIDTNIAEKSVQSHYFIKFTNGLRLENNLHALSGISFEFNNTVGPKSISKQELIYKFNPLLLGQESQSKNK